MSPSNLSGLGGIPIAGLTQATTRLGDLHLGSSIIAGGLPWVQSFCGRPLPLAFSADSASLRMNPPPSSAGCS